MRLFPTGSGRWALITGATLFTVTLAEAKLKMVELPGVVTEATIGYVSAWTPCGLLGYGCVAEKVRWPAREPPVSAEIRRPS